jgi:hypothetical protein
VSIPVAADIKRHNGDARVGQRARAFSSSALLIAERPLMSRCLAWW